jgi:hypothetical protein
MSDSDGRLKPNHQSETAVRPAARTQFIDWYSKGQSRIVDFDGVKLTVRLVDRKGRRSRIAIDLIGYLT